MKLVTVSLTVGLALVASLSLAGAASILKECSYDAMLPLYEECLKAGKEGTTERSDCVKVKLNPLAESCAAKIGDSKDNFHVGLVQAVGFLARNRPEAVMQFMTTYSMFN